MKETMIESYLVRLQKEKRLSMRLTKKMFYEILFRRCPKLMETKYIIMENDEIVNIIDPYLKLITLTWDVYRISLI
jgi:hypothetical protein